MQQCLKKEKEETPTMSGRNKPPHICDAMQDYRDAWPIFFTRLPTDAHYFPHFCLKLYASPLVVFVHIVVIVVIFHIVILLIINQYFGY